MSDSGPALRHVVVLLESRVLQSLAEQLSPDRYRLGFAESSDDLLRLHVTSPVDAILVPLVAPLPVAHAVRLLGFRDGVRIIATSHRAGRPGLAEDAPAIYEAVVSPEDAGGLVAAVLAATGERRSEPRVLVRLPVTMASGGRATTEDVSGSALRIRTRVPLHLGQPLRVVIHDMTPCPVLTRVESIRPETPAGTWSVLLQAVGSDPARAGLRELVQRHLSRGHLPDQRTDRSGIPGPVGWQLARRAEQRDRRDWSVAGPQANLLGPGARAEIPAHGLASRYLLGAALAGEDRERWCVGHRRLSGRPVWIWRLTSGEQRDRDARARLELAARAGGRLLDVAGVLPVIDFGSDGEGGLYLATPAVPGETLASLVARGERLGRADLARLGAHVAAALGAAHRRGVVHGAVDARRVWLRQEAGGVVTPLLARFEDPVGCAPAADAQAFLRLMAVLAVAWGAPAELLAELADVDPTVHGGLEILAHRLALVAADHGQSDRSANRVSDPPFQVEVSGPVGSSSAAAFPERRADGGGSIEDLFAGLAQEIGVGVAIAP